MTEYIERKEALEIVKRTSGDYAAAWSAITKIPAADVDPVVHGRNITESHPSDEFICSVCVFVCRDITRSVYDGDTDDWTDYEYTPKYCPDCGAKMDEVKE